MQFQHGTYTRAANGSLTLSPIAVDGRQLLSNPCSYDSALFTRYNQTEMFLVCVLLPDLPPSEIYQEPGERLTQGFRDTTWGSTNTTTCSASNSSSSTARP